MSEPITIRPASGKLGILLPGMGAVATTFIAGVALFPPHRKLLQKRRHLRLQAPAGECMRKRHSPFSAH